MNKIYKTSPILKKRTIIKRSKFKSYKLIFNNYTNTLFLKFLIILKNKGK